MREAVALANHEGVKGVARVQAARALGGGGGGAARIGSRVGAKRQRDLPVGLDLPDRVLHLQGIPRKLFEGREDLGRESLFELFGDKGAGDPDGELGVR